MNLLVRNQAETAVEEAATSDEARTHRAALTGVGVATRPAAAPPAMLEPAAGRRTDVSQRRAAIPACLHHIFERQVDLDPSALALECADRAWTYGEADTQANRMARALRDRGVGRGAFVGIMLDRSEWPILAILAALKSGAAYVPLEPSLPNERLRYIAEAAGLASVITETRHEQRAKDVTGADILTLEAHREAAGAFSPARLPLEESGPRGEDVCYVLFTSGTTGRPKGVVTEHRNVVGFVAAFNEVCDTGPADRVFQGFSLGFDGSVEEMWMAFSNGAALVCGDATTPRFGADLAAFLERRRISFLSTVPTLLSTLPAGIPSLRQLVVSGEACHPDLVERWSRPGLRLLNVYGPTEATVNTTAAELRPGRPVTIGRPLRGYAIHILDEGLRPLPRGESGELYIGGPSLARGYLNQPELTARAFIDWHPPADQPDGAARPSQSLRLYKTGDRVRWNGDGELEFFGRIDSQVKLRGFRIELSEVEAVLAEQPGVGTAVVRVHEEAGEKCLAAYVRRADGSTGIDRMQVLAALRGRLPAYMVPSFLDELSEIPFLPSGKVDRNRLPPPATALVAMSGNATAMTEPEARVAAVWARILKLSSVGPDQNFFTDLNGHSLLAAQLVRALREDMGCSVPVRDVYAHPTVRELAARVALSGPASDPLPRPQCSCEALSGATAKRRRWPTIAVQYVYLLAILPILALPVVWLIPLADGALRNRASVLPLAAMTVAIGLATWAAAIVVAVLAKWLLIGRYRPGRYPLWGSFYVRWWLVSRLQHLSAMSAANGTPLAPLLWRAMGAKVGRRCFLEPSLVYAWDCIEIGDDVSIGADTQLPGARIEDGCLVIGTVSIGDRCFVGAHSVLGLNVRMGSYSALDDQSLLPDNAVAPSGATLRGSPARQADVALPVGPAPRSGRLRPAAFAIAQIAAGITTVLAMLAPLAVAAWLTAILVLHFPARVSIPAFAAVVPVTTLAFAVWTAICKRLVHPRPRPGMWQIYSVKHLQHWLAALVFQVARVIGLPIFTTVYLPPWMRLLGARLGRNTEMSTVWRLDPDMLEAGDGVFFADGCMVPGSRAHLGWQWARESRIGDRSFLGNSAILSAGQSLGSDSLLGVVSALPHATAAIPGRTDWLGSPGFRLPNRDKAAQFDAGVTYRPSAWLYFQRGLIDGLRVLLPGYVLGIIGILSLLVVLSVYDLYGAWGAYTAVPLLAWLAIALCLTTVVGLKWLIMGRYEPVVVPLWCRYVWWNELVNGLYESLMAPIITNFFGTPVAVGLLRLLGCRIGRRCYIETALFSEFDLVEIGDDVALNAGVIIQNHLFEDRVMKSSALRIGDRCSVANMSVVLYDTVMEPEAVLGPMSLLMKGEMLPGGQLWQGIPTARCDRLI